MREGEIIEYPIAETKLQYNVLLKRYNISEKWLDDSKRTDAEIKKWMPEFLSIIKNLNLLLHKIGKHTVEEAIRGFKEGNT